MTLTTGFLIALLACADDSALREFQAEERHMGVSFKIVLYAADEQAAKGAFAAAFARIAELDRVMSDYNPESELSRLSDASPTAAPVPVSDDLFAVLSRAQRFSRRSKGAFDVTVGPLTKLWRRARRDGELPSEERLSEALAAVGFRRLQLDETAKTAELLRPEMRLDLGGIAKGYAVDAAFQVLADRGMKRALVNGSGDLYAGDPPPGTDGWRVGVAPRVEGGPPTIDLKVSRRAVATSGDAFQFVEIAGKRYSHIVDPKTGLGLTDRSGVTVVAADCTSADALASAVSVLGPERGLELFEREKSTAALIVRAPEGRVEIHRSAAFDNLPRF